MQILHCYVEELYISRICPHSLGYTNGKHLWCTDFAFPFAGHWYPSISNPARNADRTRSDPNSIRELWKAVSTATSVSHSQKLSAVVFVQQQENGNAC